MWTVKIWFTSFTLAYRLNGYGAVQFHHYFLDNSDGLIINCKWCIDASLLPGNVGFGREILENAIQRVSLEKDDLGQSLACLLRELEVSVHIPIELWRSLSIWSFSISDQQLPHSQLHINSEEIMHTIRMLLWEGVHP